MNIANNLFSIKNFNKINFKSKYKDLEIKAAPPEVTKAVYQYTHQTTPTLYPNINDRSLLMKIFNNVELSENECIKISTEDQDTLQLYFEDIPAKDESNQSFLVRLKSGFILATRYNQDNGTQINLVPLRAKKSYGKDPHILGLEYRYHDLSEQEKIKQLRQYSRSDRRKLGKEIDNVDKKNLGFTLPTVKDRPLKIMFLSIYPYDNPQNPYQSIGPNYIESYLKNNLPNQIDFKHLETSIYSKEEIKKQISEYKPDVIGLSTKVNSYKQFDEWMEYFGKNLKDTPVVIGGQMANSSWGEIINDYPNSLIMFDNGEVPFLELSKIMLGKKHIADIGKIPNLCFNLDKKSHLTAFKDYNYIVSEHSIPSDTNVEEVLKHNGIIAIRLSQGCWGNCSFCTHPGKWNGANIDKIIQVLKEWKEKYNLKSVFFTDDEVVNKSPEEAKARMNELADKLIEADLGITWTTSLRADSIAWLDKELVDKLKKSGCASGFLGIESGSQTQLERYGKPVNGVKVGVDVNLAALKFYEENNMTAGVGWIGFDPLMPTLRELKENIEFIETSGMLEHNVRLDGAMRAQRGSKYPIKLAEYNMGLLGDLQPNMFHYDATYLDPRAGAIKDHIVKWHEDMRDFDDEINNIKFILACNPRIADKYSKVLEISKNIQQLTLEYLKQLVAQFPDDEDDKILNGIISSDASKKSIASQKMYDNEFMKNRRERLVRVVTDSREDLLAIQKEYKSKRDALIREFYKQKYLLEKCVKDKIIDFGTSSIS